MGRRKNACVWALAALLTVGACSSGSPVPESRAGDDEFCDFYRQLIDFREEAGSRVPVDTTPEELRRQFEREDSLLGLIAGAAPSSLARAFEHERGLDAVVHDVTLRRWGRKDGRDLLDQARADGHVRIIDFLFPEGIQARGSQERTPVSEYSQLEDVNTERLALECADVPRLSVTKDQPELPPGLIVYTNLDGFRLNALQTPSFRSIAIGQPSDTQVNEPRLSPDGSQLAYILYGKDSEPTRLWVARSDGSEAHLLIDDDAQESCMGSWSPDGSTIVATREEPAPSFETRVELVDPDGGMSVVPLGKDPDFDCATFLGGDAILGIRGGEEYPRASVWMATTDGRDLRPFIELPGCGAVFPVPNPYGDRVGYLAACDDPLKNGLYVTDGEGGAGRAAIRGRVGAFAWSPDGEWLVFGYVPPDGDRKHPSLYVRRVDGGPSYRIAANAAFPTWGPAA